jgi:hypothetical protein
MNVYGLQSTDLSNLGPSRAVEFFRRLLWCEASRVNIGRNLINCPDCINVGDGGLDAVINDAEPLFDDIIPAGSSGFQIKSSDLAPARCKEELHQSNSLTNSIKSEIQRLLNNNGTYILVLFTDITETQRRHRKEAILEELQNSGFHDPKIRLYTINQIQSFAERFPALIIWLKGYPRTVLPYSKWGEHSDMKYPVTFIYDPQREIILHEIREKLENPDGTTPIFRISGLSGIGKTRLVYEALSPDNLKNRVIYTSSESFKISDLLTLIQLDDNIEVTIVIDECPLLDHDRFVRFFSEKGQRLALITISYEMDDSPPPTLYYQLHTLSKDNIKELLSQEIGGLPVPVIERLAEFADGYPRAAMLLGESYHSNSSFQEDIIIINDNALITRLIAGIQDPSSEWVRKTKKVLTGVSLFEKIGYRGEVASEAQWVVTLMEMEWGEFQEIIQEQKERGIIQGDYYIYVTPFFLAVHLCREWWVTHGYDMDFQMFVDEIPEEIRSELTNRFLSRFPYITTTEPGSTLIKGLLSEDGLFSDETYFKSKIGANFFLKLAEGDPESALNCLNRTIGTWKREELLAFTTGRREIVVSLERMAMWDKLFEDAAKLLFKLGEAENEKYSNNASGVFIDLFSPAPLYVSSTEAPLEKRFNLLIEFANSDSIEGKKLALKAFKKALQTKNFTRTIGAEYQGSKPLPRFWVPKTRKEILDYYHNMWTYLDENLDRIDDEVKKEVAETLLDSAYGISLINDQMSEMVIGTIRKMASFSWIEKEQLLKVISRIIHYSAAKMPENVLKKWINLKDELTGSSFSDLLKRYVGMNIHEDYFHNGKRFDEKWIISKIQELAKIAINNPEILKLEYSWLVTKEAKRGQQFGYEIGKLDRKFFLLEKILEEQKKSSDITSISFLGGYINVLFEKNISLWEKKMDELAIDDFFQKLIPEITWYSGMTDKAAKRILKLAKEGDIEIKNFEAFKFGGKVKKISEPIFLKWISFLIKDSSGIGIIIALEFLDIYYISKEGSKDLPKKLTYQILLHPALWEESRELSGIHMVDYHWKDIALELIKQFPDVSKLIANQILKFFENPKGILSGLNPDIQEVLLEITRRNPKETWAKITEYLGPPIDTRAFYIQEWLKGSLLLKEKGALNFFNPEDVFSWVENDLENRAWYCATFVPPILFYSEDEICYARELLVRYGDREDVRENFSANYSTEGWKGSMSDHYLDKKKQLLELKKREKNENVIRWINQYIERLEKDIKRAKLLEEKENFI